MNKRIIWITFGFMLCLIGTVMANDIKLETEGPLYISVTSQKTNCPTDPNGSATVTVEGGKAPFSYKWNNGETTSTIVGLTAGTYRVTVMDALGSTKNGLITVEATNQLEVVFNQRQITCTNEADGKVVVIPQGGDAPFTYLWNDGSQKSFLDGIGEGMYMVTVTDANGCSAEDGIMVMEPDPLRIKANYAHVSCGEDADGFMEVIASGGTAPYGFFWELDGQGGTRREGLKPGLYSVTVTDANGCTAMICPEIRQAQPPLLVSSSLPETCPGEADGRGTVNANGDSPPYKYFWPNNESQNATAFNLSPGTYEVTVTNFRNCSATVEVVVGQAGGGFGFTVATNGASCGTDANGSANVRITGGVAPFVYQWVDESTNTTISNEVSVSGLRAGNYEVRVTDANGCFGQQDVLIVEKPVPSVTASATEGEVCFGESTGSAMAIGTGGEGTITYRWSNGQAGPNATNLAAGTYTVTATDVNGCNASTNITITERPQLIINEEVSNLLCYNEAGGLIIANVTGGSGVYTYAWSNGATTDRISNIQAGVFILDVTDSDGCQLSKSISIGEPPEINLSVSTTEATDLNSSDGSAIVSVSGGTGPFTYLWSNGVTTANISNVPAGTYQVTITDANGCEETAIVILAASCTISMTLNGIPATNCNGDNGMVEAIVTGEKDGVSYLWSNGATTSTIAGLTAGTYSVTVTDGKGCTVNANLSIDGTQPMQISEQVTDLICNGEAGGQIIVTVAGGTGPFTYNWSNGRTGNAIENILAGIYTVTVIDSQGCQLSKAININQPSSINISVSTTNAADIETADGSASVTVSGGTAPYTYLWNDGSTGTSISNKPAGTYEVTVTDANGCKQTQSIVIGATCTLMAAITDARASNCAGGNGAVTVTVEGAQNGVSFQWSNGETTSAIAGLSPGFYGVTVTDGNGCQYASGAFVGDGCNCTEPVIENVLVFESACNQNTGSIKVEMQGDENLFNYQWSNPEITGNAGAGLAAGAYTVTITAKDDSQCSIVQTIGVGNTNIGPVIQLQNNPEICNGQKGSALFIPGGLEYTWSDGGTGNFRDDLSAGEYLVTVTIPGEPDCKDILVVKIGQESGLTLTPQVNQQPDCGESNGSVTIDVAGGSGNYSYSWGAATLNNLPSGTFYVEVTDNISGCKESILFTLTENVGGLTIGIDSIKHVTCPGLSDGMVFFNLNSSNELVEPISTVITDGFGKEYDSNNLPAGNYCLIVKDGNGCNAGQSCFEITEPDLFLVNVTVIPKTCANNNSILLTSSGGNGLYTYNWTDLDGPINPRDRRNIENGSYSVVVSDEAGCSVVVNDIMVNGECFICALDVSANIDVIPECGLPNGAATIEVNNFFGNLSYSWGTDSIRTDLLAGTYTVTVTDDFRGCDTTVSFTLTEPDLPSEATISELIVCPDEVGKIDYDLDNFRCFKQPLSVTITDEAGSLYDENTLGAFGNYIFVVKDADGIEINRQFFSVESYGSIIVDAATLDEGCTTLGNIDLQLANAEENYTIQWEDLTGENQSADRTDLQEGNYTVTITDNVNGGCSVTQTYSIDKAIDIEANLLPTQLTCDLTPATFNLEGEGIVSYEWSPAVLIVDGQGTPTPTVIGDGFETDFEVIAKNAFGCSVEKQITLFSINTDPNDGIKSSPQCGGLTVNFSNEDESAQFYQWDFGDGNTSNEANPTHTYDVAGDYIVKLTLKPEVPCAEDKGVIARKDLQLVPDAETTANFEIQYDPCQDEGKIQFNDNSTVTPGNITEWNWDFGNGLTSNEQNPSITLTEDADLEVTLSIKTDIGCDSEASSIQNFKVNNLPQLPASVQVCPGIPTALNPDNFKEGVNYKWSPAEFLDDPTSQNPIATTFEPVEFMVKITQEECVRESTIQADVPEEQAYDLSEDEEVCDEEERLIFVNAPVNSAIEWTNSATGEVISNEAELMVTPGIYQVKLTDEFDCPITDEVAIENFAISAEIINDTDPCEGGDGFLEIQNTGEEAITNIQWEDSEGIISPDLMGDMIEVSPAATTDYSVTLKNDFNCETTLSTTVAVSNIEDMAVIAERDTIFRGESVPINVAPEGNYTIEWSPSGTLQSMNGFDQIATPEETTTYTVTIIDNETGCIIELQVTVVVKEVVCGIPNVFVPNAFSPNGDGFNDVLFVRGSAITKLYFAVYNRWGEKVFETTDQSIGWDGTFKGEQVVNDVYGYLLEVTCLDGETFENQGNVTVLN